MKINLCSNRQDYYSQLNNELDPYISCQVTSMLAGLDIIGYPLNLIAELTDKKQPEDSLREYMLTNSDVQNFWKRNWPGSSIPAPEYAGAMVYVVNKIYGKEICYYDEKLTIEKILDDLQSGLPVYTSMKYPNNINFAGKLSPVEGHIVLIVGVDDNRFIINDPYKNHLTGEKDGFNNYYSAAQYAKHNKGYGIRYRSAK